ncbi:MAG TPA: hypothetical protein VGM30_20635 [Puia sp.]|jgi:hypothetical protein
MKLLYLFLLFVCMALLLPAHSQTVPPATGEVRANKPTHHDRSHPLRKTATDKDKDKDAAGDANSEEEEEEREGALEPGSAASGKGGSEYHFHSTKAIQAGAAIEQTQPGSRPSPEELASFDGLGEGFKGPQGTAIYRNPSDNALAVGPDHIVQIVNSRMAVYTKKGKRYDSTGRVLYGPGETRNVFRGFGGPCEKLNNGDAVVRYDQLANRWLIVMPTFRRVIGRNDPKDSIRSRMDKDRPQPGKAEAIYQPPPSFPEPRPAQQGPRQPRPAEEGTYCMCYAISTSPDPLGSYYRYEFDRPLFPDYPRPAIWPDGYYTTSSTSDNLIQRQLFIVDRAKMLKGKNATEQSFIINDVNFLLNADIDGKQLPPKGSPNIMMADGGTQLHKIIEDDGIYVWKVHVDWKDTTKTKLEGPLKITVAPYHYLGDGQLTKAVPQPGVEQHLDSQGDKLMSRLVYRRIGSQESLVAAHSVNTSTGGGGVRWYEFRVDGQRNVSLYQQGTYAPGGEYRWLPGAAMDGRGNIGIGYSYGSAEHFPGQRFAGRLAGDSLGLLTLKEAVLVIGESAQTTTLRWEDYTYSAVDPSDDNTIWYVGDYLKKDAKNYTTRIGAFRMPDKKKP